MNSRERVQTALNFENPDRTPVFASFVPEIEKLLRKHTVIDEPDLGAGLGNDMIKGCVGLERSFYGQPEPEYTDAWGITWIYSCTGPSYTGRYTSREYQGILSYGS